MGPQPRKSPSSSTTDAVTSTDVPPADDDIYGGGLGNAPEAEHLSDDESIGDDELSNERARLSIKYGQSALTYISCGDAINGIFSKESEMHPLVFSLCLYFLEELK